MSVILTVCHIQLSNPDPGCYNLTKKLTADTNNPLSTSHPDTTVVPTTPSSNMFTDKRKLPMVQVYISAYC